MKNPLVSDQMREDLDLECISIPSMSEELENQTPTLNSQENSTSYSNNSDPSNLGMVSNFVTDDEDEILNQKPVDVDQDHDEDEAAINSISKPPAGKTETFGIGLCIVQMDEVYGLSG